jgi:predicted CopG family antitoxin
MIEMTSKMISIKEDVYENLKRLKKPNESFSDVISRLIISRKKDPLKHFGIASDLGDEFNDEFENAIIRARKEDSSKVEKRIKENWEEPE